MLTHTPLVPTPSSLSSCSGKSTLLTGLLGDLQPMQLGVGESDHSSNTGNVTASAPTAGLQGSAAYVPQVPWLSPGTVRDNIVFGAPWDEAWYSRVLQACCLGPDLQGLPAGDATAVKEGGSNLSGGWVRWRCWLEG